MKNHNPTKTNIANLDRNYHPVLWCVVFPFSLVKFQQAKCLSHGSIRICLSFFNSCCFSCRASFATVGEAENHVTWVIHKWSSIWCLWNSLLEIDNLNKYQPGKNLNKKSFRNFDNSVGKAWYGYANDFFLSMPTPCNLCLEDLQGPAAIKWIKGEIQKLTKYSASP